MKLAPIVLKLRAANTRFGQYIGGAAELNLALQNTLLVESAFVIPLAESANPNNVEPSLNQTITERFGVIIALKNDTDTTDKLGLTAYDLLHDIRETLFNALLGWTIPDAESSISYRGGRLIDIDSAWMWYQFEFDFNSRLGEIQKGDDGYSIFGLLGNNFNYESGAVDWNSIYAKYILSPSKSLPYGASLSDNVSSIAWPNIGQWIDMTDRPYNGAFEKFDFSSEFEFFDEKAYNNRRM